ncbi:MAG: phosphatase PAP2 family protein [Alphaproteobacteria bacterium]|nr:phosphatase PAP2 family protein [Alphaproteobacteria bacterium]
MSTGTKHEARPGVLARRWPAVAIGLVVVFFGTILLFDHRVAVTLANWPEGELRFFAWLTEFGEGAVVLVPALILWLGGLVGGALVRRYWWRWGLRGLSAVSGFTFAAVGLPGLISAILKRLFGRARPVWLDTEGVFSFSFFQPMRWDFQSFPSGHATTSLAFALAMVMLFGRAAWWVFVPAVLIAFSRVAIGMHFTSDMVFGVALGLFGAWAVGAFWRQRGWVFAPAPPASGWRDRFVPVLGRQAGRIIQRARRGSVRARPTDRP